MKMFSILPPLHEFPVPGQKAGPTVGAAGGGKLGVQSCHPVVLATLLDASHGRMLLVGIRNKYLQKYSFSFHYYLLYYKLKII
jgi:hypothetical protein